MIEVWKFLGNHCRDCEVMKRPLKPGQDFHCEKTVWLSDSCFHESGHYHETVPEDFRCEKFPNGLQEGKS